MFGFSNGQVPRAGKPAAGEHQALRGRARRTGSGSSFWTPKNGERLGKNGSFHMFPWGYPNRWMVYPMVN